MAPSKTPSRDESARGGGGGGGAAGYSSTTSRRPIVNVPHGHEAAVDGVVILGNECPGWARRARVTALSFARSCRRRIVRRWTPPGSATEATALFPYEAFTNVRGVVADYAAHGGKLDFASITMPVSIRHATRTPWFPSVTPGS